MSGLMDDIKFCVRATGSQSWPLEMAEFAQGCCDRVAKALDDRSHVIEFRDDGWTIAHPLHERLDGSLFDCTARWDGDPGVRGRFDLTHDFTMDIWHFTLPAEG